MDLVCGMFLNLDFPSRACVWRRRISVYYCIDMKSKGGRDEEERKRKASDLGSGGGRTSGLAIYRTGSFCKGPLRRWKLKSSVTSGDNEVKL